MDRETAKQLAEEIREMAISRGSYTSRTPHATASHIFPGVRDANSSEHGTQAQSPPTRAQIARICEGVARGEFKLASIADIRTPFDIWRVPGVLDVLYGISGPPNIDVRFKAVVEMCAIAQVLHGSSITSDVESRVIVQTVLVVLSAPLVVQRALVSIFDMLLPIMMTVIVREAQCRGGSPSEAVDVLKNFIAAFKIVPVGSDSRFASGQSKKSIALDIMRRARVAPELMREIEAWEDDGNPHDYDGVSVGIADDSPTAP